MKTKWFMMVTLTAMIALSVTTVQVDAAALNGGDSIEIEPAEAFPSAMGDDPIEPAEAFPSAMTYNGDDSAAPEPAE